MVKEAETNALVVDRAVAALSSLKRIGTEQARCEYHIILGALAPPMVAVGGFERHGPTRECTAPCPPRSARASPLW